MKPIGPTAAFLISITAACGRPAGAPSAVPSGEAPPATSVADAGTSLADAGTVAVDATSGVGYREIDADLSMLVGGMLSPDHVGLGPYNALVARYEAEPARYLTRLASVYLHDENQIPNHANLYVAELLWRMRPLDPDDVERAASRFLGAWTLELQRSDLEPGPRARLEEQAKLAKVLAGGIDRIASEAWSPAEVSSACVTPVPGGQGFIVTQDCTCGQPLACSVSVEKDGIVVAVRRDDAAPAVCDDCYPGWTSCAVRGLHAGARLRVTVNGKPMGTVDVDEAGWLPRDRCIGMQ